MCVASVWEEGYVPLTGLMLRIPLLLYFILKSMSKKTSSSYLVLKFKSYFGTDADLKNSIGTWIWHLCMLEKFSYLLVRFSMRNTAVYHQCTLRILWPWSLNLHIFICECCRFCTSREFYEYLNLTSVLISTWAQNICMLLNTQMIHEFEFS
jgi:hypothetical protein